MIIDSLSLYRKDAHKKSLYILAAFSEHYPPIHRPRKKGNEIPLYISSGRPTVHTHSKRKPALEMSGVEGHYSGLFIPDPQRPELAFGDMAGTEDALLVIIHDGQAEVLACKGKKSVSSQLYAMLADADQDLMSEIEEHRTRAKQQMVY